MQLTFRAKLLLILITAALSLVLVVVGSALIGVQQARDLADVEGRLIPRLEFGPRIEGEFEHLSQAMQDAVAAQDSAALEVAEGVRIRLFELIANAAPALDSASAAQLRWTIQDYYKDAESVSRRLIAGETGEALVDDIAHMQQRQRRARELIAKTTRLERHELSSGFAAVRNATLRANRFRLAIGLCGLGLLIGLSLWAARGMLRIVGDISRGFARFATGDFSGAIAVESKDELGRIAKEANQMAQSLRRLAEQREREDWLKAAQFGLLEQIRGELSPERLAERALAFLVRRIDARVGAVYLSDAEGTLTLCAHHALSEASGASADKREPVRTFKSGEGLPGQAALSDDLVVVDDLPEGYLKVRSGLGESKPQSLLLLPLVHLKKTLGVLEFALLGSESQRSRELLISIREPLVVALAAAKSRLVLRDLLEEAQQLAERLATQEEELRVNNHELRAQQEELRRANEELEAQRAALRTQNDELEDARRRLQQKAEELTKVSSYKSQFLANMSHELRTPLNSMLLLSQMLSENEGRNLTPKQVLHCKTIHSAGEDLLGLINQVLDLAKIESGRQAIELEVVALADFVGYVRRLFEPMAAEKRVALVCEIADDLPASITTDRQRVERILTNLLANALKFTDRGQVSLRIQRPEARGGRVGNAERSSLVAFVISDTGIGIPPEAHERIFAPFEQVESRSDRRYTGTGLGLAITRESAELLGGELVLESSSEKGSVFVCYLPEDSGAARAKPNGDARQSRLPAVPDDRTRLESGAPRLLLIEDDRVLTEQLLDIAHACSFQVIATNSGEEGLQLAREHRPKGILLDVKLPDIDGWTVMDRLRRDPRTRDIPVHFLSGVDAAERGLALGAVGYLTKPVTHAELTAAVRSVAPLAGPHRRILVVEDNVDAAELVVELLAREKLAAAHAQTAAQALELIGKEPFACIILDLGLPDMDGTQVLEALKARVPSPPPPIIVHTGRALTKQETRLLETYADSVVLKDGNSDQRLIEEVRLFVRHIEDKLPRERKSDAGELLRSADVTLANVKVLIAEDDIRTVYALSALLAGKGAEVLVAENGREALELLELHHDVRAVLMDIMMPEMDGYEAIRRLRRESRFAALPVIALTAKAMKGERERCLEAGASDYLTKPVDGERLLATLKDWLDRDVQHATGRN